VETAFYLVVLAHLPSWVYAVYVDRTPFSKQDFDFVFCLVPAVRFFAAPITAAETAPITAPATGTPRALPAMAPTAAPPSVLPAVHPTPSGAQGKPLKQVKIAYCSQLLCGVPYEVARSAGLFKQHGDNYFVRGQEKNSLAPAARLTDPASGRAMEISSTEPCVQFYTGRFLDGSLIGKSGRAYSSHAALCLECQRYPNGANAPHLGNIILRPGMTYRQTTVHAFYVDADSHSDAKDPL